MWFGYHPDVLEQFPGITAAVIWVDSFQNLPECDEVDGLLASSEGLIRERCPDRSSIAQQAPIAAWREAYSRMGLKPNRYPCATEQLMRRIVDDKPMPRISALVDLCNAAALRSMIPVAPFDLARVSEFCEVRYASGTEKFWPINAAEPDDIPEGEVIFADNSPELISRRWAWRQSNKGKITPETEKLVIVAEAMHADGSLAVQTTGEFLSEHLRDLLGARIRVEYLDHNHPRSEHDALAAS
jgi:DNA/RNA-binding domain of Phe-tRNA-synthetase-like protein